MGTSETLKKVWGNDSFLLALILTPIIANSTSGRDKKHTAVVTKRLCVACGVEFTRFLAPGQTYCCNPCFYAAKGRRKREMRASDEEPWSQSAEGYPTTQRELPESEPMSAAKKNKYGIPEAVLSQIRSRDKHCVYCGSLLLYPYRRKEPARCGTIEHLSHNPPFYWKDGLRAEGIAYCCGSCNSSRGKKALTDWFATRYCKDKTINAKTVAASVRSYLEMERNQKPELVAFEEESDGRVGAIVDSGGTTPSPPLEPLEEMGENRWDRLGELGEGDLK